jgi:hypothetical protein
MKGIMRTFLTSSGLLLAFAAAAAGAPPEAAGLEFFEKKVRPVLVEHCYKCHSAEAKKPRGGLALDSGAALRQGGDSGPAVVPGKPQESLLLKAVRYTDEHLRMPPKGKLPAAVIADLEQWVALGAPDPRGEAGPAAAAARPIDLHEGRKFWAFQPPRRHPVPPVQDASWPANAIDRFILAQLEARGLRPAPDADRATLLRRVSFDLLGLPPTPEQVAAFVHDRSPDAFARVVDGLLASPHFGERWGRHWLDVARFAESSGGGRSLLFPDAWRYRDYVIASFNADKPYDRFVQEQVAGDLLPAATPDERRQQLVATAFLALGPTNYERQDKDILEMDVIDEQLDTLGRVFLGLTLGCARCHDHKFDPIPTRDYYALAGILRSTQTLIHDNVSRWVDQPLPLSPEQEAEVKAHEAAVAALQEKIRLARPAGSPVGVAAKGALAVRDLPGLVLDDAQAKRVGQWTPSRYSGHFIGDGYLHDGNTAKGQKTLTFVPELPHPGRYEVRLAYVPGSNRATRVPVTVFHADGEQTVHLDQTKAPPVDGRFASLGTFRFEKDGRGYVLVANEGTTGHVIADAVQFLPEEPGARPAEPQPAAAELKKLEAELQRLTKAAPPRPVAMAVTEADRIEDCPICIRGNIHNRGEKVPRGFLQVATVAALPTVPAQESGRRQLADWLTRPDHPLTARVMANRVWHHLFGAGLVRTVDSFGATGEAPSHPELLDHLALELVAGSGPEGGWSVKRLLRAILLSRTYQLASAVSPGDARFRQARAVDPENRLLGRQNRRRLEAEALRDAILAVSGRLDRTVGGPNIRKGTTSEYGYEFDDSRRSVYTPVFRNRLLELFEAFDFADPNLVMGRRNVSTVAPQALYLLNSPFVLEQARQAARAALAVPGLDDAGRVDRAYRLALGRPPAAGERQLALRLVAAAAEGAPPEQRLAAWERPEQRLAAWERLYQALFACIDFRYVG